jgi:plasmid maintenance system antidote protein VapI
MAKSFDELVAGTTNRKTQVAAKERAEELMGELLLSELRQLTGKSQKNVAESLGIKQPSFAKMEKQDDIQVSTLRNVIHALGGELELLVRLPTGIVRLDQFGRPKKSQKNKSHH